VVVNPIPRPWARRALGTLFALLLSAHGAFAAGEEEATGPALRGWEPAVMIGFGVHAQNLRGSQAADFVEIQPGRQGKLRFSFSEAEAVLYTPTLSETLGFRLFLHGGGQFPFTREHTAENSSNSFDVNRDGAPVYSANCPAPPPNQPGFITPGFGLGDGGTGFCEVSGRNDIIVNGSLFAGLGADFTLPFGGYQFHLRPSINWFGQSLKGEGMTTRNSSLSRSHNCNRRRTTLTPTDPRICNDPATNENGNDVTDVYKLSYNQRDEVRSKTGERWMHGLGPRLELDIEVAKVGNMVFEFFAQVGIYWLLTDRTITHSSVGTIGDGTCTQKNPDFIDPNFNAPDFCSDDVPGGQPIRAFYKTDAGPYIVQGGGGFRVVWKGLTL